MNSELSLFCNPLYLPQIAEDSWNLTSCFCLFVLQYDIKDTHVVEPALIFLTAIPKTNG